MASKKKPSAKKNIDLKLAFQDLGAQFQGLDTRDPAGWPAVPRYTLLVFVAALVVGALWYFWLNSVRDDLVAAQQQEEKLRQDYRTKLQKAISLDLLKKQREQVEQYVVLLEKQLPSKAEMDALLSDINQAGLGRSLQFEMFKPGQFVTRDYYAELPIALKVTGRYHDIGSFASDIAHLSRIVTLNNLSIAPVGKDGKSDSLMLEATAKTFRYLDPDEVAAQRKAQQDKGKRK